MLLSKPTYVLTLCDVWNLKLGSKNNNYYSLLSFCILKLEARRVKASRSCYKIQVSNACLIWNRGIGYGILSSVWDMILQWGSTIKVSIELLVASRNRRDMTEKLLKATLKPNTISAVSSPKGHAKQNELLSSGMYPNLPIDYDWNVVYGKCI